MKLILFWLIIIAIAGFGWGWNIVKLVGMSEIMTGEGIVRIAGIFIGPLGAIIGYL
jgi:hypothetical protein